jgi:hypothetical protein
MCIFTYAVFNYTCNRMLYMKIMNASRAQSICKYATTKRNNGSVVGIIIFIKSYVYWLKMV